MGVSQYDALGLRLSYAAVLNVVAHISNNSHKKDSNMSKAIAQEHKQNCIHKGKLIRTTSVV
jgi:hypothetical protein